MLGIVPVITLIISLAAGHTCKLALETEGEELGRSSNWMINEHCFGVSI